MSVLQYPVATEKALNMVERGNVITYVVDFRATKTDIRKEFEKMFNVKVAKINVVFSPNNSKRAYIRLKPEFKASDMAIKLKLI